MNQKGFVEPSRAKARGSFKAEHSSGHNYPHPKGCGFRPRSVNIAIVIIIVLLVGTTPASEQTTNEEQGVFVIVGRTRYVAGEKIDSTIKNNTDKTIWLATSCGTPFSLLEKNGAEWETYGAHPTKDCAAPPLKIESKQEISYMLDLESVYAYKYFSIEPGGRYKLEIQYTGVDAKLWPLAKFVYLKSFSDEFSIVAKQHK